MARPAERDDQNLSDDLYGDGEQFVALAVGSNIMCFGITHWPRPGLLEDRKLYRRSMLSRPVDPLRGFLKVLSPRFGNFHELLRIAVHQRKPRTLHMNHNPVSATERMVDIRQLEFDLLHFARRERLGLFETLSELAPEGLAANELLIAAHLDDAIGGRWSLSGNNGGGSESGKSAG